MDLFPKQRVPYFIVSPSYTHKSSGVRTLHLLCHALNEMGERAYLIQDKPEAYATNPELNTPLLTTPHLEFYKDKDFIAVYPDIVRGNPLRAKHVVRYLLAPRGAYGGDAVFPDTDQIWGALPSIADNVLRLPVSDPNIFYKDGSVREGTCFYSHKYEMHGNQLVSLTKDSTRLEGSLENIADTLRKSTTCYVYEVSSILTEAALCGCPVTLVRTDYFNIIDPACMMGDVSWDDGEFVNETDEFAYEYHKIVTDFWLKLAIFIQKTQELV